MSDRAREAQIDFQIVVRSFLLPAAVPTAITVEKRERICALVLDAAVLVRAFVQRVVEGDVFRELNHVGVRHSGKHGRFRCTEITKRL